MEWYQILFLLLVLVALVGGGLLYYAKKHDITLSKASFRNHFVHRHLKKLAHDHDFILLKDMYVQIAENSYIRYDEILIGEKYVYVITQKHWMGTLQANIVDNKWILRHENETAYVDNPLRGVHLRLEALMHLLNAEKYNFVNIITLGKKVKFDEKIIMNNNQEIIINSHEINKQILTFEKTCTLNSLTDQEMERIANLINDENIDCRNKNKKLK